MMRAWLLLAAVLMTGCATQSASRPSGAADAQGLAGAWTHPGAKGQPARWLVLQPDGAASLLGVPGLWGIGWQAADRELVLATQTPDNPAPQEVRLGIVKRKGERLWLHAADPGLAHLSGEWSRRTGEILEVSGTITAGESLALPPDAVLRVDLQQSPRDGAEPQTLATRDIVLGTAKLPVRYVLHVPAALVDSALPCVVRARVAAAGVPRYASAGDPAVLTRAAPATADLLLQPVQPVVRLRPPPPPPAAAQIVELEHGFAAASRERGARAAFLEVLADDAIVLQPGPVFGRAQWESGPDLQGSLDWAPDRVQASAAGDLGIATGPWLLTPRAGGAPIAGRYLTVWRKSDAGWRVVFDGGFGRTAATGAKLPATAPALDFGNCERGSPVDLPVLHSLDAGITADAATPTGRRLAQLAGANLAWFEQPQAAALTGAAAARRLLGLPARQVLRPMGGAVAASGDLGYTYGLVEPAPGSAANAAYAHVWCRQRGEWKLLLGLRRSLDGG